MSQRFFSDEPITGEEVTLGGAEAHHLLHVLRAEKGQSVTLFDGSGQEFDACILDCGRRAVRLRIEASRIVSREPRLSVTLGVALPKGERQRWLVEKAVELGVSSLVPLVTDRGVAEPTASAIGRLRRAVIEASKQCGRTRLMEIIQPTACPVFLTGVPRSSGNQTLAVMAHPDGDHDAPHAEAHAPGVMLAVGPEGGFTDEEVQTARASGWTVARLGPRILRVETAALALASRYTLGNE